MDETKSVSDINYWHMETNVSTGFNRLKAKMFNLVEATIIDTKQAQALKGLIKGFANDEFSLVIENMRYSARNAGYISENMESNIPPLTAEPLEHE